MVPAVLEMRLVVTVEDYEEALAFYRDELGLPQLAAFDDGAGHVTILDAGRATLELSDVPHAEHIDAVEVGRRVAGHIRVAFEVPDAAAATDRLTAAGATLIAPPTPTPWNSLNSRLDAPGGLQLTLFQNEAPEF
ncbi:MAG TPA: VOC family protein [Candidatus Limnocylindrales bacterium]|nr:VOC family protein [Candidatus Limnocylindrales bacterium]